MKELVQQLLQFLEYRGAKKEFMYHFEKEEPNTTLDKYFGFESDVSYFISSAFDWEESDSGHQYWQKIDDAWRKYVVINKLDTQEN